MTKMTIEESELVTRFPVSSHIVNFKIAGKLSFLHFGFFAARVLHGVVDNNMHWICEGIDLCGGSAHQGIIKIPLYFVLIPFHSINMKVL